MGERLQLSDPPEKRGFDEQFIVKQVIFENLVLGE